MYKLEIGLKEGCRLVFTPKKSDDLKKIFLSDTYYYPQKIDGKRFVSLNVSSFKAFEKNKKLALREGHIFGSFFIDGANVCYISSGSLRSNRISILLGLRPFFATDNTLIYYLPDEDFENTVLPELKKYCVSQLGLERKDFLNLKNEDLDVLKYVAATPLIRIDGKLGSSASLNLDLFARFFEIYCGTNCLDVNLIYGKPCDYCTAKLGLHLLLHIVKLVPSNIWLKKYHKDLIVLLLQQDFLGDWSDITRLNETKQKILLTKAKDFLPTIEDVQDLRKETNDILRIMISRHEIFKILYFLSRYEGGSPILKTIFDNLFNLLPKKTRKYLFSPNFQPKLFMDGFELHFIMKSDKRDKIVNMARMLQDIFDEVSYLRTGIDNFNPNLRRYRFMCQVKRGSFYIDNIDLPDVIEVMCNAITTIALHNKLQFNENEAWLKKMNLKIETPPQFEEVVLEAFSKRWVLQHRLSEDVENVLLFNSKKDLGRSLDGGIIPEELKIDFKTKGFSLSEKSFVKKEENKKWNILDNEKTFIIIAKDRELNIYATLNGLMISADIFCDYPSLMKQDFKFKYLRDVQINYAVLNKRLEEEFNFKMIG